jgi:FlaA1/EpsC-like NDP-sugar epimerase
MLQGKVLITGGSGFLGRGFLRRARRESWPVDITIYSRDETKQFQVKRQFPEVRCVLGDVRDGDRLEAVMAGHDYVIHAAAVKYIPEAEYNVAETISVNVEGSRSVARAAVRSEVKAVVGVSTDKACAPLNTYGMTKALMERLFAEANAWSDTRFMTVRYGNVVGSTGSVIPMFMQQIKDYGEIRITDERMSRFWLSIDEGIDLINLAIGYGREQPGATITGANPAMRIGDLAAAVRMVAGAEVATRVTGIRPGEKLNEFLFNAQEASRVYDLDEAGGLKGFLLLPPTRGRLDAAVTSYVDGYSSDAPVRWLSPDEMCEMIEDAQALGL